MKSKASSGGHESEVSPFSSSHYQGAHGSDYFAWQDGNAGFTSHLEARKFARYVKSSDHVLDFGCGGGHILRNLNCARKVGVEVNPFARASAINAGLDCRESLMDIEDDAFHVVLSHHSLEHVENPIQVLRTLRQKLVPSGLAVIYLPVDDWRTQRRYDATDVNHHLHTWTPQLLGNSLLESGFQSDQFSIRIVTHALFPGIAKAQNWLPAPVVDAGCWIFSIAAKRRQLLAIARK
ncbi:MAG TPA: class I SAM-dependent methyltransferase [Candidatus Sulfotelmatobacter sp.]|nr:class I SAM-dependent methyltransferase [Candidatus Sulfotelmatobacter sp.]